MAKVTLAEDDQTMVNLLTTLLRMDGFEVAALDADEDIPAAISSSKPDVLVLDVHLPKQNGLDILDTLRQGDTAHRLRVIMISGLNVRDQCLAHGADDFLLKPFMPDELLDLLRKNVKAT
jgi:DNA-binding response OmpR family regulator